MNAPKLRFRNENGEVFGEWGKTLLGKACSVFKSGTSITSERISNVDKYPVFGGNGIRGYTNTYTHDGLFVLIGRQGALCGNINLSNGKSYISEHAIAVQANPKNCTMFLAHNLRRMQLNRLSESSAQPGLSVAKLIKLVIYLPTLPEQTKIANFLSAVDERIQQVSQTHALLTQYKKGVMQKIFSQELRFKDENGKAFGAWEEQAFSNIAFFLKGKGLAKTDIVNSGSYPCIRYGELYTHYAEKIDTIISRTNIDKDTCVLSKHNDVIIPASGESNIEIAKASCVLQDDVILGGDLNIIRTSENGVFLSYYLNHQKKIEIAQLAQGNSVVHLYSSQLKRLTLSIPTLPEQTKIANFLSAIDDKINQAQSQLSALQDYKRGLLQQMFV